MHRRIQAGPLRARHHCSAHRGADGLFFFCFLLFFFFNFKFRKERKIKD